jgi:Mitochondrial calcium uniporter
MIEQQIISSQRILLITHIKRMLAESEPHSAAFVLRILHNDSSLNLQNPNLIDTLASDVAYEGFPGVSGLGYMLGTEDLILQIHAASFLNGVGRLVIRSEAAIKNLAVDDVAILGLAIGLSIVKHRELEGIDAAQKWLIDIIDITPRTRLWSHRLRELAGDLLDCKGRLRVSIDQDDIDAKALEVVLRSTWPDEYEQVTSPSDKYYVRLLQELLSVRPQEGDEVEKVAVWLKALDLTVQYLTAASLPAYDRVALSNLETIKDTLDRKAIRRTRFILWLSFIIFLIVSIILALLVYYLTWSVIEPWIFVIGLLVGVCEYGYFVVTLRELNPANFFEQLEIKQRQKLYNEFGFDSAAYEQGKNLAEIEQPK